MRTVFVDPQRCIVCGQCAFACAVAHSKTRDPVMSLGESPGPRPRVHVQAGPVPNTAYPNKCHHCSPAPCVGVCPSGAISRHAVHDTVVIDGTRCIACAMCAMVCPFDTITYYPQTVQGDVRTIAVKCDGCIDWVRKGLVPACVETCKTGALRFGEINELIAADQRREADRVLVAASGGTDARQDADGITAWRATGAYVAHPGGVR